jgi:hypothetical protein
MATATVTSSKQMATSRDKAVKMPTAYAAGEQQPPPVPAFRCLMTPMIEHYNLVVLLYWLMFLFVGVFILVQVTGFFTGEYPETFRKAVGIFLVTFAVVYFSYDLSSYFFVFLMQDPGVGFVLPPGYSYWIWLREPLAVKWQVLAFVPFIRFFPILFALIMGGVAQVFLWTVPYRVGAVIFLAQVFLDLVAMTLLSYAFSWGIVLYERAVQKPERARPAPQHFSEGDLDQAAPMSLPHLAHRVRNLGPEQGTFWRRLENDWDDVNRHLHPLYALFSPVTRHLPLPVQDFLDSGGWVLVILGLTALVLSWRRVDRRRKGYVEHRKRNPPRGRHVRIELSGTAQESRPT